MREGVNGSHLFATLSTFPMLVSQSSKPSPFSRNALIFLERLTHRASSDLGVFVIPILFYFCGENQLQWDSVALMKGVVREKLTPGRSRHCC
jgi:hypothetical protein